MHMMNSRSPALIAFRKIIDDTSHFSGGPFQQIVAFSNPNGSQILEFENDSDQLLDATLQTGGKLYRLHVPAKSMNTVTRSVQSITRR